VVGVCLTFDNGPEPEVTPGVLDVLARRRIAATFFLVGQKLRDPAARACAERARAEGHAIGNHTLTHGEPLGRRGAAEAVAEIAETDALLGALHGPDRLFRPNGGGGALGPHLLNRAAADHLVAHRHTMLLWNAVPGDFRDADGWVATARSMLRDARGRVVYTAEITSPKRVLSPGESVSINEALVPVPKAAVKAQYGWKPGS